MPSSLIGVWVSCGGAFQQDYDISSDDGCAALIYWWLRTGRSEFEGVKEAIDWWIVEDMHLAHLRSTVPNDELTFTPLQYLVYRHRPDIQGVFDLNSTVGRVGFWSWWQLHGRAEYLGDCKCIHWKEPSLLLLNPLNSNSGELDVVRYQAILTLLAPATNREVSAYDTETAALFDTIHFNHIDQADQDLKQPTPLMSLIYRHRPDVQAAFNLDSADGVLGFWEWWKTYGQAEYPIVSSENLRPPTEVSSAENGRTVSKTSFSLANGDKPSSKVASAPSAQTLSLVGYPRGEFGLGEDIRLLRTSLRKAGLEPEVIRAPWKIIARQTIDEQAKEADVAEFNRDVMLYVMPAFDTLTLLNKVGLRAFQARRKIGFWQWELDRFPEPAKVAFDLVDEIWCHSEHSAKAFKSATEKPVVKVPLPVLVPEIERVPRSTFGFNDRDYIVFSSFDGASSISRKNPMGVILAFQQAFPRVSWPHARLIIKAMNTIDDALWRECLRKAALDERIRILNRVLSRHEYYELLQSCDVVLSMHRAEGFGRVMAEAMALEIPTIATGYSGNLDFMNVDNSWLIPGVLSPLMPGDYPFYQGQEWLEPDIDEAAKALRDCFENQVKRARFVGNAKATIDRYSPANCGRVYAELLAS